ncbi:MbtH family NRPS accessory protein [Enterobacteriaceae bacterium H16N7]|nr:MbtH family NRPS accessory protein [Dryocola clanedunensis]
MEFSNPFDAPQGRFFILQHADRHYSLWPEHGALPEGWLVVREPAMQEECNLWLKENWTDLQPAAFAAAGGRK